MHSFVVLVMMMGLVVQDAQSASEVPVEIAKWEQSISELEQRKQAEGVTDAYVFYGSSSIRRWDSIADDMAPWPVIQRGYGGAKLTDAGYYAPRILGPYLGMGNPDRCRGVVIFIANDISGNAESATPVETATRFSRLHRWIRQQDPTMPLFWIEVTPTHRRWDVWPQIQDATRLIRDSIDRDPCAYFIPTAGAYLGVDGRPIADLFVDDQLHLNEQGYHLWASLIKTQLHLRMGSVVLPGRK